MDTTSDDPITIAVVGGAVVGGMAAGGAFSGGGGGGMGSMAAPAPAKKTAKPVEQLSAEAKKNRQKRFASLLTRDWDVEPTLSKPGLLGLGG